MKRTTNETTLKDAIQQLLKAYRLDSGVKEARVISVWDRLMGPMISSRTKEIRIRDGVLFLRIDSPPLREELKYGKSRIIKLINDEAGTEIIRDVVIN